MYESIVFIAILATIQKVLCTVSVCILHSAVQMFRYYYSDPSIRSVIPFSAYRIDMYPTPYNRAVLISHYSVTCVSSYYCQIRCIDATDLDLYRESCSVTRAQLMTLFRKYNKTSLCQSNLSGLFKAVDRRFMSNRRVATCTHDQDKVQKRTA